MNENNKPRHQEIFSRSLRSGRQTLFFDVKTNNQNKHFISITESKKFTEIDGSFHFKKNKIEINETDIQEFSRLLHEITTFLSDLKTIEK